jgi:hypothetical protein
MIHSSNQPSCHVPLRPSTGKTGPASSHGSPKHSHPEFLIRTRFLSGKMRFCIACLHSFFVVDFVC